ncbi:MAG: hypothetical protein E6Q76_19610 [Rhizobium sp.]|nr:MAG: hypothetical protein E6Q76_19610 [Rhizobium sp.]
MAAPDPYAGTSEEFTALHWLECVQSFRPSGANSFSQTSGEAVLTGYVPAARVRGALRFLVGYNNVETVATFGTPPYTSTRLIQRTNPVYHPRYTRLICTNAAEEEFKPGDYMPGFGTRLKAGSNPRRIAATDLGARALYKWAKITARFQPPPYELAGDEGIDRQAAEWQRNVTIDVEPRIEFLSLDGFKLIIAEGETNTAPLTNPKGKEFPAPFGQILVKPDVVVRWFLVPSSFVMGASGSLPDKILACCGKVNSTSFLSCPAGTLLMLGAKMQRFPWPLADGTEPAFVYNIDFMLNYFNPSKGKTGDAQITTNLGHNNAPWRGNAVEGGIVAGDTNAGKWFLATRTGGNGASSVDPRLIEDIDLNLLFRSAL